MFGSVFNFSSLIFLLIADAGFASGSIYYCFLDSARCSSGIAGVDISWGLGIDIGSDVFGRVFLRWRNMI